MKKMFLLALAAIGFVASSCSKNEHSPDYVGEDSKGSLTVTIRGENALGRAIGEPSADNEKTVKSFTVYVFNYSTGVIEKSQSFDGVLTGKIEGLGVASPKRVVVFVNQPADFPSITEYGDFADTDNLLALDTQVPGDFSSKGLFMSGEASGAVTLKTDDVVNVPVTVKRLTAKIKLGGITVIPELGLNLSDFELTGVSVQKARDKAPVMGGLATAGFGYIGGLDNGGLVVNPFLNEFIQLPVDYTSGTRYEPKAYFYVFANDDTNGEATLLSVHGEYKGTPMYYSFYINDKASSTGGNSTDGNFIERNKVYTLNVTLRKIGNGGEDPDVPNEAADMTVTVDIAPWEDELAQEVEW